MRRAERQIERARRIARNVLDTLTAERMEQLVRDYEQLLLAVNCKDKA